MTNVQGQPQTAGAKADFDAVIIGAGFSGMYMLKFAARQAWDLKVTVYRGRRHRRRHLVLEPLSRRTLRFRLLHLLLHLRQATAAGMGVVRTLSRAARDPALPRARAPNAIDLKRDIQFDTRVDRAPTSMTTTNVWRVRTDKGDDVTARYLIAAVGTLSTANMPPFKGLENFQGQVVPHQPVPARRRRLHRQARRRGRHRCHRGAGDSRDRAAGEAAHGVPAHRQLLRAGAQRQGRPRSGQGAQGRLRRHRRAHPRVVLRLRALLHPEVGARDHARGARARVRQDVGRRRLRLLARQLSGHVLHPRRRTTSSPTTSSARSARPSRTRWSPRSSSPRATPTAPSASRWTPTTSRPSTRTTCCWSTRAPTVQSRRSPRRAFAPAARSTSSTSSSSPPASTR